jgi:hypothetical protein
MVWLNSKHRNSEHVGSCCFSLQKAAISWRETSLLARVRSVREADEINLRIMIECYINNQPQITDGLSFVNPSDSAS